MQIRSGEGADTMKGYVEAFKNQAKMKELLV